MPELPEVETIRRSLRPLIIDSRLIGIEAFHPVVLIDYLEADITHTKISALRRRGKYLMLDFADDKMVQQATIMIHPRMTGKLLFQENFIEPAKHTHVRFHLEKDFTEHYLDFNDTRRFGRVWLLPPGGENLDPGFSRLGPEPTEEDWTAEDFLRQIKRHPKSSIKAVLLNQEVVAGIGNIYCDESLFRAGIHPARKAGSLSETELLCLQQTVRDVISEAIGHQGTSFRDYVDGLGHSGYFQLQLKVFQRQGKPCTICSTPIEKIKVAGRGTHYCPKCQKL